MLILGVPLAWVLARLEFPGRGLLRALVTLPLVLPPVVGGVALFLAFGRNGVVGQLAVRAFGVSCPSPPPVSSSPKRSWPCPSWSCPSRARCAAMDSRYEEAAATLGASGWYTFRRVTLPMLAPGMAAGAVLCWARALGEFGATITFAGNFPGTTQTMPLAVYLALQDDPEAAIALSLVLLVVSVAILAACATAGCGVTRPRSTPACSVDPRAASPCDVRCPYPQAESRAARAQRRRQVDGPARIGRPVAADGGACACRRGGLEDR